VVIYRHRTGRPWEYLVGGLRNL